VTPLPPAVPEVLRCPQCRAPLALDASGCAGCGRPTLRDDGVLDLVIDPERDAERAYYEETYAERAADGTRSLAELEAVWTHPAKPVHGALRHRIGDLAGKRVLLVGNGGSAKELHFLESEPELLVFSDLSAAGVAAVRDAFDVSGHAGRVCFAAIDALDLPIADGSVDLVYGNAFVHHLPDRPRFLAEVMRVLRPGGEAVFMDDGYSPVWQFAKRAVLRPVMAYSHRRYPRSPEDQRETLQGGFREEDIVREVRSAGADAEAWFQRLGFTYYFWRRASLVLFPPRWRSLGEHPRIAGPLIELDRRLARRPRMRRHLVRLLWGVRRTA
jgi:SAM-dependent methyltransferase